MSHALSTAELKAQAKQLRKRLANLGEKIGHSEALERVAHVLGFKDWNTCAAAAEKDDREKRLRFAGDLRKTRPAFDFRSRSEEEIKQFVGASGLDLVLKKANENWWAKFVQYFWNYGVYERENGIAIQFYDTEDHDADWIEFKSNSVHVIVLASLASDWPEDGERVTASTATKLARGEKLVVTDGDAEAQAWAHDDDPRKRAAAAKRDPDVVVRVYANHPNALPVIQNLPCATNFDETEEEASERDPDAIRDKVFAVGVSWQNHSLYEEPDEFWELGDEFEVSAVDKSGAVVILKHLASGRTIELPMTEVWGRFWPSEMVLSDDEMAS